MSTIIEAARGNWDKIFREFGITPSRRHSKEECPFCGKKNSFRVSPERIEYGGWICTCGSGNGFGLLMQITGKAFRELAQEIDRILGIAYRKVAPRLKLVTPVDRWAELQPLRGTDAELYLKSRGINILPKRGVKFGYETIHNKRYGAIYSIASNSKGDACYLHTTYLDGHKKAVFESLPSKKLTTIKQNQDSVSVRTDYADKTMGISEGFETGLSAEQRFKMPVWPTLSTAFMKRFVVSDNVESLIIFADSDKKGAGHAAAFACAHSNLVRDNKLKRVEVRWPKSGDFNDDPNCDLYSWIFEL